MSHTFLNTHKTNFLNIAKTSSPRVCILKRCIKILKLYLLQDQRIRSLNSISTKCTCTYIVGTIHSLPCHAIFTLWTYTCTWKCFHLLCSCCPGPWSVLSLCSAGSVSHSPCFSPSPQRPPCSRETDALSPLEAEPDYKGQSRKRKVRYMYVISDIEIAWNRHHGTIKSSKSMCKRVK